MNKALITVKHADDVSARVFTNVDRSRFVFEMRAEDDSVIMTSEHATLLEALEELHRFNCDEYFAYD